jgi:hypothetical protein
MYLYGIIEDMQGNMGEANEHGKLNTLIDENMYT